MSGSTSHTNPAASDLPPDDPRALLLARDLAPEAARRVLSRYGFADPDRADRTLARVAAAGGAEERHALAGLLPALLDGLAAAGSPDRGLANLERFFAASGARLTLLRSLAADRAALERAIVLSSQSQYFADVLVREPRLLEWLGAQATPPSAEELLREIRESLAPLGDDAHRVAALHRAKRRELLACGFRDHVLSRPLPDVAADLSRLADTLIEAALDVAWARLRPRFPDFPPVPLPFAVIALGKLGGGELNYSSDVDLLFVHDELFAAPAPLSPRELFDRLGREIVQILSGTGDEGALYRVDLRLRPEGAQGALSRGIAAYLRYYETYGRTWERQALLKARAVAGDRALAARFLAAIEPFVYRRYLDVAAIGEIKALKRKVEARGAAQPTRDVKEGPGGIRDIEFAVQFLELLYGGELPSVRDPSTLGALARLEREGCVAPEDARTMREAYVFLRTVEHRLQTLEARQTHVLPSAPEEIADLARRTGFRGADARERFLADLDRHGTGAREVLERLLHGLFPEAGSADGAAAAAASELLLDPDPPREKVERVLSSFELRDPERAMADLRRLAAEKSRFLGASPRTRTYLASLLPSLLRALSERANPDETLNRFERATATLGGKAVFYQLLVENPDTLDLFVRVAAESDFLTGLLTHNPGVFDELVDLLLTSEPVTVERVLSRMTDPALDDRDAALRAVWLSTTLLVGFRDLGERWNVANVLEALSALAEATLRALVSADSGLAVFGLGKLGGRELGYGSDLDLLPAFEGEEAEAALRATQALVRKMEALGLYAIDLRLRPQGTAGPLASSFRALEDYYASGRAATWERLAATKVRPIAGDLEAAGRFLPRLLAAVFALPKDTALATDVRAMRAKLEQAASGPLDLKRAPGGLVDIEFTAAFLKLRSGGNPPEIRDPGVVPALHSLARAGLLDRAAYVDLLTGYQFLRKIEARLRIVEGRPVSKIPAEGPAQRALARRLGYVDTRRRSAEAAFLDELEFHTRAVRTRFDEVLRG